MRRELKVLVVFGLVSLFADVTYEGARSITGAYLDVLGASAIAASLIGGSELVSYAARGLGGLLARRGSSARYWLLVFAGYVVNLVSVPLLALAGAWPLALGLVFAERIGKGLRTPARDAILAEVTEKLGTGKGFGLHELLDQVGAVSGPLLVALIVSGGFHKAYASLGAPAAIAILLLLLAYTLHPKVESAAGSSRQASPLEARGTCGKLLLLFAVFFPLGLLHWGLAAYRLQSEALLGVELIALAYALAMLVDAAVAVPAGYAFDAVGPKVLVAAPIVAMLSTPALLLAGDPLALLVSAALWGAAIGVYETVFRASLAKLVEAGRRAYMYGVTGMGFGLSWLVGSLVLAAAYTSAFRFSAVAMFVLVAEIVAVVSAYSLGACRER